MIDRIQLFLTLDNILFQFVSKNEVCFLLYIVILLLFSIFNETRWNIQYNRGFLLAVPYQLDIQRSGGLILSDFFQVTSDPNG